MSTILKALDRLEAEKKADSDERPLREQVTRRHSAPASRGLGRRARAAGVAAGVALLGVALAVTLFISGVPLRPSETESAEISSARRVDPRGDADERDSLAPSSAGSAGREERVSAPSEAWGETPSPAPNPELAASVPRPRAAHPVADATGNAPAPSARPATTRSAPAEIPAPARSAPPAPPRTAQIPVAESAPPDRALVAAVSPRPDPPAVRAIGAEDALPRVAAPAPRKPPQVLVSRTIWHPSAARRLAVLEVKGRDEPLRVREGDAVGELSVRTIEPWGVVFLDAGVEIRRRVGARE